MAHGIEYFDKVVSRHGTEWHGKAIHVNEDMDVHRAAKEIRLDQWSILEEPIEYKGKKVDGHKLLVCSDNNHVISVVGAKYRPVQPKEIIDFISDLTVDKNVAKVTSAGTFWNREDVVFSVEIPREYRVNNDEMRPYLLVSNNNAAKRKFVVGFTATRVICNNTHKIALRELKGSRYYSMKHTEGLGSRIQDVRLALELGIKAFDNMDEEMHKMISVVDPTVIKSYYDEVVPLPNKPANASGTSLKRWETKVEKARESRVKMNQRMMYESDTLKQKPNLWLAYNSVNWYNENHSRINQEDDYSLNRPFSIALGRIGELNIDAYDAAYDMMLANA
jgi:phage/plasmid-like protein (TIGR03299 family)